MSGEQIVVRAMARAFVRAGLSTAYGHCSVRLDSTTFLVCAPKPMGLIQPGEPGISVPTTGPLPEGTLGEVRIHQAIYRRRPHIGAVCRFISPNVLALAALGRAPKPRHGFGAYFHPEVPFWPDPALIRNNDAAAGVAERMADAPAVVVSVNGAVTAAETPQRALTLACYLEDAARVELAVLSCGMAETAPLLTAAECRTRATWEGRVAERMWAYLTHGDPEL